MKSLLNKAAILAVGLCVSGTLMAQASVDELSLIHI